MDPAYSSFVALIYFTSKYRHPVITSLYLRSLDDKSRTVAQHGNSENPDDCRVRDNQGLSPASAARSTKNALVVFEPGSSTSVVEERPEPSRPQPSMLTRPTSDDFSADLPPQSLTLPLESVGSRTPSRGTASSVHLTELHDPKAKLGYLNDRN